MASNSTFIKLRPWHPVPSLHDKRWGNSERLFWGAPKSLKLVTAVMKSRSLLLGRKAMINLDSILKSRDILLVLVGIPYVPYAIYVVCQV